MTDMPDLTTFECWNCGDEFDVLTSAIQEDGEPKWCSTECLKAGDEHE